VTVQLLTGDCREVMREMEAGSVQVVVTSPPYWSLRDYGTDPLIWGGDEGCSHQWGEERIRKTSPQRDHGADGGFGNTRGEEGWRAGAAYEASQGAWCSLCGAWRGSLGLEPTPDCGRPRMELRGDLSEAEREYVLAELNRLGLIDIAPRECEDQQSRDEDAHGAANSGREGTA